MGKASIPTEVIRRDEGIEQLLVPKGEVRVVAGPDRGKSCPLRRGQVVVGTGAECDLVLSDPAVSHRQFELVSSVQGFVLRDLGSTNGTFVGKLRVQEVVLGETTEIQVGRTRIKFAARDEQEGFPLSPHHRFGSLLGKSPLMRHCFALLERIVQTDSTVLLEGESGTGKEVAAQSLHQLSARSAGPFVVTDCGAIAPSLVESELFGHEKGAFTGADAQKTGALERADGGTLFLDEIGELDVALQPKLLRFLEGREVRRLGGTQSRVIDVRLVSATNRRLEERVREGAFREDLFFRLAVLRVELPPLRRRPEDIPLLALEMARRLRPDADPASWLDERALAVLQSHHWPGNVRELRNVVERLAVLPELPLEAALGGRLGPPGEPHEQSLVSSRLTYHDAKERVLDAFERGYVAQLLDEEQGVVARAAERAGVPRQTFFRLIRKHGLRGE
jgi:transcriptional regulator with PAS, ATPase and Fis domain